MRKLFFTALLAAPFLLNSCASILNSKDQDVKIRTNSKNTKVYNEGDSVGEGRNMVVPMKRDGDDKQFVIKRDGYKDEYRVIGQYKNSNWKILTWFPFGILLLPPALDQGDKSKVYKDSYYFKNDLKIKERTKDQKYVFLNNTVYDLDPKDFRLYFHDAKDYYEDDYVQDEYIYTEEESKFEDEEITDVMNSILKKHNYIDTTEKIITTNNNTLYVDAKVDHVHVNRISLDKWVSFVTTETKIEWKILNAYEEEKFSTTIESQSGEIDVDYYENPIDFSLADAIHEGFFELVQKEKVQNLLEKDAELDKTFEGTISLNKGQSPKTLPEAQEATVTLGNDEGHGSGVVVSKDGYIITNYHVGSQEDIKVFVGDGQELEPEMVRANKAADLCLMKVDHKFDKTFRLPKNSSYNSGQTIYTIGTPSSKELGQTLSKGIISGIREEDKWKLIQMDASVNPGSSGGALTDENGNLIGIVNAKLMGYGIEGIGFSIPAERARELLSLD